MTSKRKPLNEGVKQNVKCYFAEESQRKLRISWKINANTETISKCMLDMSLNSTKNMYKKIDILILF